MPESCRLRYGGGNASGMLPVHVDLCICVCHFCDRHVRGTVVQISRAITAALSRSGPVNKGMGAEKCPRGGVGRGASAGPL